MGKGISVLPKLELHLLDNRTLKMRQVAVVRTERHVVDLMEAKGIRVTLRRNFADNTITASSWLEGGQILAAIGTDRKGIRLPGFIVNLLG